MKILLCCEAGVTSTLFSTKLKEAATRRGVDSTVWSASKYAVEFSADLADVILVEPQLRSHVDAIKKMVPEKPVILISDDDFTNFNALKIFDQAYEAVNK